MAKYKNDKIQIDYLLDELEKIKKEEDGHVSFDAFGMEDIQSILRSKIEFEINIPECEENNLIRKAIFNCGKKNSLKSKSFIREISQNEKYFLGKENINYDVVTSISIKYLPKLRFIKFNSNSIRFYPFLPKKYNQSAILSKLQTYNKDFFTIPQEYTVVIISTKARSHCEAVEKALNTFETIRGIWNFNNNRYTYKRKSTGYFSPTNEILLGPIHTLHFTDGSLATEDYWYEIMDTKEYTAKNINSRFDFIKKEEIRIRKNLNKITYGGDLKKIFLRYNNALDSIDFSSSIIHLWSILEYLTHTIEKNYDRTISRTICLFNEPIYFKQILESIRYKRNKIVHASYREITGETVIYQLKYLIENLLLFHLFNKYKFTNLEEVGEFLDLSKDNAQLQRKIKLLKFNMKFNNLY